MDRHQVNATDSFRTGLKLQIVRLGRYHGALQERCRLAQEHFLVGDECKVSGKHYGHMQYVAHDNVGAVLRRKR